MNGGSALGPQCPPLLKRCAHTVIPLRTHDHGISWGEGVEVLQVEREELFALSIAGSDDVQGIVDGSAAAVLAYGRGHGCLVVCGGEWDDCKVGQNAALDEALHVLR